MQIVKADAYGHGAYQISKKAIESGAEMLGIANADEGKLLRYKQINIPILILSPSLDSEIGVILDYDLTPTITNLEFAEKLDDQAQAAGLIRKVHINIDSGMGRSGIIPAEAHSLLKKISLLKNLEIEGIFSHYAASENDPAFTEEQSCIFQQFLEEIEQRPKFVHIANSSAVVNFQDSYTNLVRLGLLTYGVYSDNSLLDKIDLKPVMTFKSYVAQTKTAQPGESIGYNRTFVCKKRTKYAVVPVGYADGYDYLLSNRGKVVIRDQICPLIGKVSMDMITVDVTKVENIQLLDEVILLGAEQKEVNADSLTGLYNGSSYELLCQVGRRAKRYYREYGKFTASSPLLRRDFVSYDFPEQELNVIIENAIEQRLQNKEIAATIYNDFLERFIAEKDLNIHYRKDFQHHVSFRKCDIPDLDDYYSVETTLSYVKILQQEHFYIACAQNEAALEKYFQKGNVEYRWLLDGSIDLNGDNFEITEVKVNELELNCSSKLENDCLEIRCSHSRLAELINQQVTFSISTRTYYPKEYQQLTVYISEMTRGVEISFDYHDLFSEVDAITVFSARNKFPQMIRKLAE